MVKETVDPRKPKPGETRAEYQERRKKEIEKAKKPLTYAQQRLWQKRDMRQKAKYTPESKTGTDKLNYKRWYLDNLISEHNEKAIRARRLAEKANRNGDGQKANKYKEIEEEHRRKAEIHQLRKIPLDKEIRAREEAKEQKHQ